MSAARKHFGLAAVLVLIALERQVAGRQRARHVPKIHELKLCDDKTHFTELNYINITMRDDGFEYVNLNATLKTDINVISKIVFAVHRCAGAVSANQCEYYNTYTWNAAICQVLVMKGVFWTPGVESFKPKVGCPFRKGHFVATNGGLNYDQISAMLGSSFEKFIWRLELQIFNEVREMAVCGFAVGELRRVAARPKGST